MNAAFATHGLDAPETAVLIAIPHAGRCYPEAMQPMIRLSQDQLIILEDRYADALVTRAVEAGHSCIIAQTARAWIDLNRNSDEIDSEMIDVADRKKFSLRATSKVRGGLGLIPRRLARCGEIWREPISADDIDRRISAVHSPYHTAISDALAARQQRYGQALLIDLHSMPPLKPELGRPEAHFVVGDLFGRSAHPDLVDCALDEIQAAGFRASRNRPYAGGYCLERHGAPHRARHAIQIEIDRRLYLDAALDQIGPGAAVISQLVLRLADALAATLHSISALPLAAE